MIGRLGRFRVADAGLAVAKFAVGVFSAYAADSPQVYLDIDRDKSRWRLATSLGDGAVP